MPFEKILIANRGEIAVRIIRACRALGIAPVAVFTEPDRGALHTRLADEALCIGPADAYLDAGQIVAAALRAGAQAVHPGYGFLSERAHFARRCAEAGLVFIGPPPEAIELLGSKAAAKRLAESAGVPTLPGYSGEDQRPETLRAAAERLGPPLLIKASAGGGGRGMRAVHDLAQLGEALASARREALAAFGDDAVLLERLVSRPRHIEIQILADAHGGAVHLFERECSIQRRHQKIVEESPSPALTPALRDSMGDAALRLVRAAGYQGAGTVEFLLDERDGAYFFLEVNTRLQVEHPVTELVTGLDLVQLQIAVAAGERLPFSQTDLRQRGHAIEVRVCAEDPETLLPAAGRLALLSAPGGPGIRHDTGVQTGDELGVHYDTMFAKLIVHAASRPAAVALLRRALDEYAALGVATNLPLLRAVAASPAFAAGDTTTAFLNEHDLAPALRAPERTPAAPLIAAALDLLTAAAPADPWDTLGWAPLRVGRRLVLEDMSGERTVDLERVEGGWRATLDGAAYHARVIERAPGFVTLSLAAVGAEERLERVRLAPDGSRLLAHWRGQSFELALPTPPSLDALAARAGYGGHAGLEAPMPGGVARVLVSEGERVATHQPLVVLEAMKMEHIVAAPHAGVVRRVHVAPGATVARGAALVEIEAD